MERVRRGELTNEAWEHHVAPRLRRQSRGLSVVVTPGQHHEREYATRGVDRRDPGGAAGGFVGKAAQAPGATRPEKAAQGASRAALGFALDLRCYPHRV